MSFSHRLSWPVQHNALSRARFERLSAGLPVLDFSESNPTRVGIQRDADPLLAALSDPRNLGYEPDPRGLGRIRERLARWYAGRGCAVASDALFLTSSTSEAYGWLFKLLCDPGDAILVPRPGYPLFDYLAVLEGVESRPYRLEYRHPGGWSLDFDSLAAGLARGRVKAVVVINPNNPTGSYLAREERRSLLELCARAGVALIADEVFFDYRLEAREPGSLAGESTVLCFTLDGLSKRAGLPQLKLGWILLSGPPSELAEASSRLEIIADAYLSASAPAMNALPFLLDEGERFIGGLRERCAGNLVLLRTLLEGEGSPHRVLRCEGGWTALIESPRLESEEELGLGLLRGKGLWSQPGYFFDMEREAFFSASLILPSAILERCASAYREYFDELAR
ncbi:MAG TPA: pyridoxal phosphate-dependent aminotransferase [Rectinemataceae bacterium]|nr:pyridoxal phosphate-dependent aminotransferase [Rectinemataceae bacterium]